MARQPHPQEYAEALGRFIEQFAEIEATMQIMLWFFAGVPWEIGRAVFSGVRTDQAMDHIRRITEVKPPTPAIRKELEEVFAQLKAIADVRNAIVHYGTKYVNDTDLVSSNSLMALTPKKKRDWNVSADMLKDMSADLKKISAHLVGIKFPRLEKIEPDTSALRKSPWQYKRPGHKQE